MDEDFEFVLQEPEGTLDYDSPIPDDTMCVATVMKTERVQKTFPSDPLPVTRLKWKFRIDEPEDYRDRYVTGESGVKFVNHPSCRILSWVQATLGINPLPANYGFNQPDLWNRPVRVLIGARVGKDKTTGEDRTYNYVEDVLPATASAAPGPFADDDF
jgi:hypothetical protein